MRKGKIYDRAKLKAGNRIPGPAVVMEMDSTTVILPGHTGVVDRFGNILINPDKGGAAKAKAASETSTSNKSTAKKSAKKGAATRGKVATKSTGAKAKPAAGKKKAAKKKAAKR